jgi:hypothetical protein
LTLAIVTDPPLESFAKDLAKGLQMNVCIFDNPVVFHPEVQNGKIVRRGVVSVAGQVTTDIRNILARCFSP